MKTSLDKAGRILLPKRLRAELGLKPGDDLEIKKSSDGIMLRPVRAIAKL
jgi:AbrB family looped-hinge helix DNA binding protein